MLYRSLRSYLLNQAEEYDLLARVTQHPLRPKPQREIDQIFMLPGSQLNQVKLMSTYLRNRSVVFVGDGDSMALSFALLAKERVIESPGQMVVLDFDERIVGFINQVARDNNLHDRVRAQHYNVLNPIPDEMRDRFDVFYTNPPYGSSNRGASGLAFLIRCMAACKPVNSSGIAILPYATETWSSEAMHRIQNYMNTHGYVIGDMLRDMHLYHLDDSPDLRSATVIFDRVERIETPHATESLPAEFTRFFYGSDDRGIPLGIGLDGELRY